MKLAAVFIHGIGGSSEDWAKPIIEKLELKVMERLRKRLKDKAPSDISEVLIVKSVYWKTVLDKPQEELGNVLHKYYFQILRHIAWFWVPFISLFKNWYKTQTMVITRYIGDIIGYMAKEARTGVHEKIDAALEAIRAEVKAGNGEKIPVSFISHSLGTVINSNYIYDKLNANRVQGINYFHQDFLIANLFMAGSPLALFSMKFGGPESFNNPIDVETPEGVWLNFLDKDDPIAMPLKTLNASYDKVVHEDVFVNAGWMPFTAHMEYFNKSNVLDVIADKLVEDWSRLARLA